MIKYSIIIPTSDRKNTFPSVLKTVCDEKYENFEIIVQDNCSNWDVLSEINKLNDNRIKYFRTQSKVDMCTNWELALNNYSGKYVTFLGDDDGWIAGSLPIIDSIFLQFPNIDIITWDQHEYGWPDAIKLIRDRIVINKGNNGEIIKSKQALYSVISYQKLFRILPKIYNSFYSRNVLVKFKEIYGSYFLDRSNPDITTGLQACFVTDHYIHLKEPITIIGTSGSSSGASTLEKPVLNSGDGLPGYLECNLVKEIAKKAYNVDLFILNTFYIFCRFHNALNSLNFIGGIELFLNNLPRDLRGKVCDYIYDKITEMDCPGIGPFILNKINTGLNFDSEFEGQSLACGLKLLTDSKFKAIIDCTQVGVSDIYQAAWLIKNLTRFS